MDARTSRTAPQPLRWTHRLAVATAVCAVPLLLFGGSVTTLGAGMAVEGWLVAEGDFLLLFPVEKWFRDLPTFVEHTHRLFGVLVGLLAIATVAAAHREDGGGAERARAVRRAAWLSLLAVCLQGTVGGLRVLENSRELALAHGALAQLVFAVLCLGAHRAGAVGRRSGAASAAPERTARRWGLLAAALVLAQVVLGAWYRHGLRPEPVADASGRLQLHLVGALAVVCVVAVLHARLRAADRLPEARRRLAVLVAVQVALGFLAWAGFRPGSVGALEWACSVLHVAGGALLFAQCAVVALGAGPGALLRRPRPAGAARRFEPAGRVGGLP